MLYAGIPTNNTWIKISIPTLCSSVICEAIAVVVKITGTSQLYKSITRQPFKIIKRTNRSGGGDKMTLREIREKSKLSIEEAANKLGIAYDYLIMLENNRRKPSRKLLKRMIEVYSVKPEKIFLAVYGTICS